MNNKRGSGSRHPRQGGRPAHRPLSAQSVSRSVGARNARPRPKSASAARDEHVSRARKEQASRVKRVAPDQRRRSVPPHSQSATHRDQRARRAPSPAMRREIAARNKARRAAIIRRRRMMKLVSWVVIGVGLIVAVMWLIGFSLKKIEEHATPPDPAVALEPVPCQIDQLSAKLSSQGRTAGQPVNVAVTMKNTRGKVPCVMETSAKDFTLTLKTGKATVFDSRACEAGISAPRLLLSKDMETTQTFTWNGMYSGQVCSTAGPAAPGTYVAHVKYMGEELTAKGYVFELQAPPAPEAKPAE
ncbi:hypothetical protein [Arcanobacterium buesumense]|uniref:Uncharacterized protein n=1 Tax=Arcanobacterium buesumense TaxID=2722751 RepID=A0A6H2EKT7_9ACTO|nr:hypothetical protein [Arcanobacterium buesumense]QJC21292.1 hypothetical protein HC352_01330 [Arcanobacterium buesumense]